MVPDGQLSTSEEADPVIDIYGRESMDNCWRDHWEMGSCVRRFPYISISPLFYLYQPFVPPNAYLSGRHCGVLTVNGAELY